MPLGAPFKSVTIWDGVEKRFRKRLAMWKRQYISKGGRITLIRSTLFNLPILQLPRGVRLRLEQIQRDFLWGGGALVRRPHLVRWATTYLLKRKWGLGVKSISTLNTALICKWSWRFANKKGALWNQVIRRKYGEKQGGWCSRDVREGYGVGLWKTIRKFGHTVSSRLSFVVGNRQRVSFWKDAWCGDTPLWVSFPSLFALADPKEAWVKDVRSGTAKGVEVLALQGPLTIGRWKRWRAFCYACVVKNWSWKRRIGCSGWKQRMEFSRQSHFTKFLNFISNEEHLEVVCEAKSKLLCLGGFLG